MDYSKSKIEETLFSIIDKTKEKYFQRIGKNIYVENVDENIRITINSNTYRIITVDRINY